MANEISSFLSYSSQNNFRGRTIIIGGNYGECRYMEFRFRGISTAFYIFIKLPDVNIINYALTPQPPHPCSSLCKKLLSSPYKRYRPLIGLGIPTKARTSHENELPLFMYYRVSNVETYTLASFPDTRGS
jgi:hypothetical protein